MGGGKKEKTATWGAMLNALMGYRPIAMGGLISSLVAR